MKKILGAYSCFILVIVLNPNNGIGQGIPQSDSSQSNSKGEQQSTSQTTSIYNGRYIWDEAVLMSKCDATGHNTKDVQLSKKNQIFRVINTMLKDGKPDNVVIIIDDYNKTSGPNYKTYNKDGGRQLYFSVSAEAFNAKAKKFFVVADGLSIGTLNFPFKYRPQRGRTDFNSAFNFGAALGYSFWHKSTSRYTWSIVLGFSASNIGLDSITSIKAQNNPTIASDLRSANNFGGFSFSLGGLIQNEKVQLGIFLGSDWVSATTHSKYDWAYQGKPWLSIGWGLSIFSPEKQKGSNDDKQTSKN